MTERLTLLQFQSPWQGRKGFRRYALDLSTGQLEPSKRVKPKKLMKKGKGGIDGLILKPAWPTTRSLCVLPHDDSLRLHEVSNGRMDPEGGFIDLSDPAYRGDIAERLAFRSFTFADAHNRIRFSDLEGRLFGPTRTPFEIFPTTDFSPFARLVRILDAPAARRKLIEDLKDCRFDYPDWSVPGVAEPSFQTRSA